MHSLYIYRDEWKRSFDRKYIENGFELCYNSANNFIRVTPPSENGNGKPRAKPNSSKPAVYNFISSILAINPYEFHVLESSSCTQHIDSRVKYIIKRVSNKSGFPREHEVLSKLPKNRLFSNIFGYIANRQGSVNWIIIHKRGVCLSMMRRDFLNNQDNVNRLMVNLKQAVVKMYDAGVIHYDLKLGNIAYDAEINTFSFFDFDKAFLFKEMASNSKSSYFDTSSGFIINRNISLEQAFCVTLQSLLATVERSSPLLFKKIDTLNKSKCRDQTKKPKKPKK